MQALSTMTSLEEGAWAPIHHAAVRNHAATMARLLDTAGPEELEAPTRDGLRNTPLLLAAASASYQVAELLVGRGADVAALNAQQHGVAELCALHGHWALLRYFLALGDPRVNVCARLISLLQSDVDREALSAGLALAHLMDEASGAAPCPAPRLLEQGLVPAVLGMLGKDASHTVKEQALHLLNSLLRARGGKEEVAKHGGIQVLVSLLSEGAEGLLGGVVGAICEIACEKSFAEELHSAGAIPAFQRVLSAARRGSSSCLGTGSGEPLAAGSLRSLDLMAEACKSCKDDMGKQHGFLSGLVQLAEECRSPSLMIVWSEVVESVTANHPNNQAAFLAVDGAVPLIHMMKSKARDVQLQAIKALHRLVEGNPDAQKKVLELGGTLPLIQLLQKSQSPHVQEVVADALWALAGAETECQRTVAEGMGVNMLVGFLRSVSQKLHQIGIEGLGVLLQGPRDMRNAVFSANGVDHLVRMLCSERENIVLSTIRVLRHVCLGIGYIPHYKNQIAIANSRGLKFLLALMIHSPYEAIQAEAAYTLSAVVLGNSENLEILSHSSAFQYRYILPLLYSSEEEIRLLTAGALATFAFNNVSEQRAIIQAGGVRWHHFQPFLQSSKEIHRIQAAFQSIVLSRIIPDNEPANITAIGIRTIVDTLERSQAHHTLALAADCVARLAHTRAGIAAALVSIDAVGVLFQLLSSSVDLVQSCAAVALGYLSFNHVAERQLLKRCRKKPHLVGNLLLYTRKHKISPTFLARWKHSQELRLPPIRNKPALVSSMHMKFSVVHPLPGKCQWLSVMFLSSIPQDVITF
ncbi:ankyrin and armadillo repeat-containing protein isoform X1 [Alligator mississippiensis]|uniref:Ankyrin and armadillo repeat-containing protein-like n=2 Tax=Alligator mississippiensis TaxID=8496 RepID=A0A151N7Y6_ALLMI|nr:ankyrin and armadillo repeat-containing protein isoform X1 [Alligator mississippiensis]KYO32635.1 ankyrin and armadillo repeat-containing protein-like [Alligator mississippiensis]